MSQLNIIISGFWQNALVILQPTSCGNMVLVESVADALLITHNFKLIRSSLDRTFSIWMYMIKCF